MGNNKKESKEPTKRLLRCSSWTKEEDDQLVNILSSTSSSTADSSGENNSTKKRKATQQIDDKKESKQKDLHQKGKGQTMTKNDENNTDEKKTPDKKKAPSSSSSIEKHTDFTWICSICREAECATDPDSDLLICEGGCQRVFHFPCVGLPAKQHTTNNTSTTPSSEEDDDEIWMCPDCKGKKHQCAICKVYGVDNVDVFQCDKNGCGLFFHEGCLSMYNVNVEIIAEDSNNAINSNNSNNNSSSEGRPTFICPAHECWTCSQNISASFSKSNTTTTATTKNTKKKKNKKNDHFQRKQGDLFRCLECPISYHISCIAPNARFHELALLCHEHSKSSKLPHLDLEKSIQNEVEAEIDEQMKKFKKKRKRAQNCNENGETSCSSRFFLSSMNNNGKGGTHQNSFFNSVFCQPVNNDKPKKNNNDIDQDEESVLERTSSELYMCKKDFTELLHSKPPPYKHIHSLYYNPSSRPKRSPPNENGTCNCVGICDENTCLNRIIFMECVGVEDKVNKAYANCECGPNTCSNRKLGQKKIAKCRPKRQHGKGWGLISLEKNGIQKGDLVQEYVGEVINETAMRQRQEKWSLDHPNDPNFYVMHLGDGWYIDARLKGNLSRFINHSCDPNCKLVPYNVAGYMRIGIFALRDIQQGEFLSYDYQFDTKQHGNEFLCRCGSQNCRGTLNKQKSAKEKKKMNKQNKNKTKKKNGSSNDTSSSSTASSPWKCLDMMENNYSIAKDTTEQGDEEEQDGEEKEYRTKKQIEEDAKAQFEQNIKFLKDVANDEITRLNCVGLLKPGENTTRNGGATSCVELSENMSSCATVAYGLIEKDREFVIQHKLFLWRNAVAGSDFSSPRWNRKKK